MIGWVHAGDTQCLGSLGQRVNRGINFTSFTSRSSVLFKRIQYMLDFFPSSMQRMTKQTSESTSIGTSDSLRASMYVFGKKDNVI